MPAPSLLLSTPAHESVARRLLSGLSLGEQVAAARLPQLPPDWIEFALLVADSGLSLERQKAEGYNHLVPEALRRVLRNEVRVRDADTRVRNADARADDADTLAHDAQVRANDAELRAHDAQAHVHVADIHRNVVSRLQDGRRAAARKRRAETERIAAAIASIRQQDSTLTQIRAIWRNRKDNTPGWDELPWDVRNRCCEALAARLRRHRKK